MGHQNDPEIRDWTNSEDSACSLEKKKLSFGVIGAGYWGPNIIRNIIENPNCSLKTVCDRDEIKLAYLQQQAMFSHQKLVWTTKSDAVLAMPDVDAVAIVTDIASHFQLAKQALEHHKHVFVEKPLAMTAEQCQILGKLAERNNCILMVGHTFIYNPAVEHLKQIVDNGELGNIYYLHAQRVNLGRAQTNVNALWSLSVHDVAITLHLFEELPSEIRCVGQSFITPGIEDVVFLHLLFPSGRMAHLHTSWLDPEKRRQVTIVGDKKMVVYDDVSLDQKIAIYDKGIQKTPLLMMPHPEYQDFTGFQLLTRVGGVETPDVDFEEPLKREIQHFVDCVQGRFPKPHSSWQEGYNVVRVLELAEASLKRQGMPVAFTMA